MLEIKNLHVKLEEEEKQILKGVDLTVEAGKVHAIMGPNGSGKSTLLKLCARLYQPIEGGSVSILGRPANDVVVPDLISFMEQKYAIFLGTVGYNRPLAG